MKSDLHKCKEVLAATHRELSASKLAGEELKAKYDWSEDAQNKLEEKLEKKEDPLVGKVREVEQLQDKSGEAFGAGFNLALDQVSWQEPRHFSATYC